MRGFAKGLAGAVALMALVPGEAAACWNEQTYQTAQMRDFDTMLMVATLRCRIKDLDFSTDYNRFVRDKRDVLAAGNLELRAHFASVVGRARALDAYDDFVTKIANGYGGGAEGMTCSDYAAIARAAVEAPATRAAVVKLAERVGSSPRLPGLRCNVTVALNGGK